MEPDLATLSYRVKQVELRTERVDEDVDLLKSKQTVHEEQINGKGGVVAAVDRLTHKVDGLNRALYAFAGSFIVAAITIAVAIGH